MANEAAVASPSNATGGTDQAKGATPAPGKAPEQGKDGTGNKSLPVQPAEAAKKRKYVVDGSEHEVDEKDLDTFVQKGLGADKRFKEAAKARKEAEMVLTMLRKNPMAVLEKVTKLGGGDARKVVEDWLWENHVKLEQLTPEQREAELNKRKLSDFEQQEKERAARAMQERDEKLKDHYRGHYERDIIGALESGGIPKTSKTVARMAHYMAQALKIGVKVSAKDVVPMVRQDYETEFREMFGPANAEVLAKFLGDDGLKKVREFELAKLKQQGNRPIVQPVHGGPVSKEPQEKKTLTPDEWREALDRKWGK